MINTEKLLDIRDLSISFRHDNRRANRALSNINLALKTGEVLGIVGESGSGKSLTSLAIMGLLPPRAIIDSGSIVYCDQVELLQRHPEGFFRAIRGNEISMIFQEPMTSLNPVHRCGDQVAEMIMTHGTIGQFEAKNKVIELFERVELPRPQEMYASFPHQISGGQKQRVMIAMAIACQPRLIIADEPTTALDVTVQKSIIDLLKKLCQEYNSGLIFITHDLGVIAQIADRIMVMCKGKVIEEGKASEILKMPKESYTKGLLACRPKLDGNPKRLPTVSGNVTIPEFEASKLDLKRDRKREKLLEVRKVGVHFQLRGRGNKAILKAVDDVSFEVFSGETLGLVGESGCGKSTLGRSIMGLQNIQLGHITYRNRAIMGGGGLFPKELRKKIQMIFQDPYSSLNPGKTVEQALTEPLRVHRLFRTSQEMFTRVKEMLDRVGLAQSSLQKYPHQFSGGQRQRICIARALMVEPEFIICDESVSALDVSVQAMVLNLLNDLKEDFNLTYIFISHDLSVVKYMSDRLMVMRKGRIEEMGDSEKVYANPQSAYTKALLESIPKV
ncbi:MAG: ABC transporter ATP-binding protein [Flavobacteriales bacterium]|nr:ABC transporter ATP-binding protein [Flavobacteriales bacterium]